MAFGARPPRAMENPVTWLNQALADVRARKVRHPGNHRYLFRLGNRRERSRVVIGLRPAPYPKMHCGQLELPGIA